jgi:1-aminocyclopropane-1-carboxylate synthase
MALFRFCGKRKIHLISDEIYALSVYDSGEPEAGPFTSVLSLNKEGLIDEKYVHVLYGLSKVSIIQVHLLPPDTNRAPGLRRRRNPPRCSPVSKPEPRKCMSTNGVSSNPLSVLSHPLPILRSRFHGVSGLSTTAATAILSDSVFTSTLLSTSRRRLAENFHITVAALNKMGVKYHRGANAGLFLLIDLSPFVTPSPSLTPGQEERQLSDKLLESGVFLNPGEEKAEEPGWFRVVFSQPRGDLEEGLRR